MIDSALKMYVEQVEINVQGNELLQEALLELQLLRIQHKTYPDRFRELNSLITRVEEYIFKNTKEVSNGEGLF